MGVAGKGSTSLTFNFRRVAAATLLRDRRSRAATGAVSALTLALAGAGAADAGSLIVGSAGALDRISVAVDGVELSHGGDPKMWRPEPDGPQGPMQVSAAAAADVGGGDRFDLAENRMIGRAYLARLYQRYANWPDAVAAYNWGPGNMDAWIGAGRPVDRFPVTVSLYRIRVLFGSAAPFGGRRFGPARLSPRRPLADRQHPSRQSVAVERLYSEIMSDSERATR